MIQKNRLLITGASGLLGSNLAEYFKNRYDTYGTYLSREYKAEGVQTERVDLSKNEAAQECIQRVNPDIIIHCAALADVDACEKDEAFAIKCNRDVTANVVRAIANTETKLVHISTDLVFDGQKGDYIETDQTNPINAYGRTKLMAEAEALKHAKTIVARTNIFGWNGARGRSLAEWAFTELENKRPIRGFTDADFSGIYIPLLAELLDKAIAQDLKGVYHFASSSSMSKYDFVCALAEVFEFDNADITPISMDDSGLTAKRAKNLSLNVNKLSKDLHTSVPAMQDSIQAFYKDFQNQDSLNNNRGAEV